MKYDVFKRVTECQVVLAAIDSMIIAGGALFVLGLIGLVWPNETFSAAVSAYMYVALNMVMSVFIIVCARTANVMVNTSYYAAMGVVVGAFLVAFVGGLTVPVLQQAPIVATAAVIAPAVAFRRYVVALFRQVKKNLAGMVGDKE
tara:strand:- start:4927 stop:5361 length:435 start_codon:yes stop_codon:yes gene_type:complete